MMRAGVFAMVWLGGCNTNIVELHQSKRYEPISCSPKGFTLYNVDGLMWEYEVDTLEWTVVARPTGFSEEWTNDPSADKPTYVQQFSDKIHYIYDSRVVISGDNVRAEYLLENAVHARKFFQMQDGAISSHNINVRKMQEGPGLMSAFAVCDAKEPRCETARWPAYVYFFGEMSAPRLLTAEMRIEQFQKNRRLSDQSCPCRSLGWDLR
jgi:hypothetical protein